MKTNYDPITHAYVHWLGEVHSAGFAPAFPSSLCDRKYLRRPPMPIASVVRGKPKNEKKDKATSLIETEKNDTKTKKKEQRNDNKYSKRPF